jgi:hypothetical protein
MRRDDDSTIYASRVHFLKAGALSLTADTRRNPTFASACRDACSCHQMKR